MAQSIKQAFQKALLNHMSGLSAQDMFGCFMRGDCVLLSVDNVLGFMCEASILNPLLPPPPPPHLSETTTL